MIVCDYNGWADAPEDEREALEALELRAASPPAQISAATFHSARLLGRWPRHRFPRRRSPRLAA